MMHNLGLNQGSVKHMGAKKWAEIVFDNLEKRNPEPPCRVGFKMMGPPVDVFGDSETRGLLNDASIKKIVLKRENTTAMWVSANTACWFRDWTTDSSSQSHTEIKAKTEEKLLAGDPPCAGGLGDFSQKMSHQYGSWLEMMRGQPILEISTENMNNDVKKVGQFLLGDDFAKGSIDLRFAHFDILKDDA